MASAIASGIAVGIVAALVARAGSARRRRGLNERLHELRRPLQCLELSLPEGPVGEPAGECMRQVRHALAALDAAVNGSRSPVAPGAFPLGRVLRSTALRWSFDPRVELEAPPEHAGLTLHGEEREIAAALDNLIANGLEHGSGGVAVSVERGVAGTRGLRVSVRNPGAAGSGPRPGPRHGHGLRIAARAAAAHGGRLHPPRDEGGEITSGLLLPAIAAPEGKGGDAA